MDRPLTLIVVWFVLLVLLAASIGSAYVDLGAGNLVANVGIAAIKASLVAWFYMHLRHGKLLVRTAAVVGLVWLAFLIGLSLADNLTRPAAPRTDLEHPDPRSSDYTPAHWEFPTSRPALATDLAPDLGGRFRYWSRPCRSGASCEWAALQAAVNFT